MNPSKGEVVNMNPSKGEVVNMNPSKGNGGILSKL